MPCRPNLVNLSNAPDEAGRGVDARHRNLDGENIACIQHRVTSKDDVGEKPVA